MICSLFLKKLKQTLRIPVLALVDSDPYGLKILSVYMKGETLVPVPVSGWFLGSFAQLCSSTRTPTASRSCPST